MENLNKSSEIEPMRVGETSWNVHRRWRDWHNAEAYRFTLLAEKTRDLGWWKSYRDEATRHALLAWECEAEMARLEDAKEAA